MKIKLPQMHNSLNLTLLFQLFFTSQLNVGDSLFENVVNAMAFSADQSYRSLDKPVDRDQ